MSGDDDTVHRERTVDVGRLRRLSSGARRQHRPLIGIRQQDDEIPLLVRADIGFDVGAELIGVWLYSTQLGGSTSR
jgi:hypothetical protein